MNWKQPLKGISQRNRFSKFILLNIKIPEWFYIHSGIFYNCLLFYTLSNSSIISLSGAPVSKLTTTIAIADKINAGRSS